VRPARLADERELRGPGRLDALLRLGLLSTARINSAIIAAAAATDRVEIGAVGSRDAARAAEYAREHGISRAHGSYEELLADPELDAVYISLPNALHHEWTLRALDAGKHVLCEKPYSRRPEEVEEAFARAGERGLVLMEAFMYRHHPQTLRVAELLAGGEIGQPRLLKAAFTFELGDLEDVRARPELDGGALMDVGCYCVSGLRLLAGEPEEASGEQLVGPTGVDMSFRGALRFPSGAVGVFRSSFQVERGQELEVVGETGRLRVEAPWRVDWGGRVLLERDDIATEVPVPEADSYVRQLENLAAAAAGEEPPLLGLEDALGQARTIAALYRSAESGAPVAVG
jgi:D-xylose 1-dehydrogenase (NADP+, D-xylono-1,5-lactone-forming)